MNRWILAALIAAALLCLAVMAALGLATKAKAQGRCGTHGDILGVLAGKFQEARRASGTINNLAMMEVFVSPKGTWTILVTDTRGLTCVIAGGDNYEQEAVAALKGAPL